MLFVYYSKAINKTSVVHHKLSIQFPQNSMTRIERRKRMLTYFVRGIITGLLLFDLFFGFGYFAYVVKLTRD